MMADQQLPPSDEEQKLMFDEKLNNRFRDTAHQAFLSVPELRSVIVVYDYYRNLNDLPNVSKGLWLAAEGSKDKTVDSVMGSYGALLQSAAHILDELFQKHAELQLQLTEMSKALLEKKREIDSIK
jgi:hypothetical protein